ncbi:hypothetical protein KIH87_08165 [Paraneptunicella aestuarii]|uniref:hypothetical protein n=1 Tax=Paraneptunicella aestuarii TaxID=2831148 RepID=UPI001E491A97|nr:hypothetical protein [Paraneptunicella aestuarii]UAA40297.1 hypothetical protein KIH87_08165 [Paraneptunicella aestuarii]
MLASQNREPAIQTNIHNNAQNDILSSVQSESMLSTDLQRPVINNHQVRFQSYANHNSSLDALLHGLSYSRRWVYYFCHDLRIKCDYNNVLQVRIERNIPLRNWVEKVLEAGQCAAIMLEKNSLSNQDIIEIKNLCENAGILLLLLEPQAHKLN